MSFDPGIYHHFPRYEVEMGIGQYLKQRRRVGSGSSSAGHVVTSLVAALGLLLGCTDPGGRAAQEPQSGPKPESSDVAAESLVDEVKTDPGVFSEFYGDWSIVGSSCPAICAMSGEEADSWTGIAATLTESAVVFGDYRCHDVTYQSRQVSKLDFLKHSRFDLEQLGILAEEVQELTVSCEGQQWFAPGNVFIVKDRETLIARWDGVYFEMKRIPSKADENVVLGAGVEGSHR